VVAEGTAAYGTTHGSAFPDGGWREMAARQGTELYNLEAGEHMQVTLSNPGYPHSLPISRLVVEADLFISVPLLKTHVSADYTVALKNSFALTTQAVRTEVHRHYLLEEALVDINRMRAPDLIVVDGWDGAEGIAGGTDFKRPAGARVMLAGNDAVAVDVISRELMGLRMRTRYLEWAIEKGVGCGDRNAITVLDEPLADLCCQFMSPGEEMCQMVPGLTLSDGDACSGCRLAALGALRRARPPRLMSPLTVIYGHWDGSAPAVGSVLVIGDCAAAASGLGRYVPGCPPDSEAVRSALLGLGVLCQRCQAIVRDALRDLPAETLSDLRVTAAGDTVYAGSGVEATGHYRALIVGECSEAYAAIVRDRAPLLGMDPDRDVIFVPGCPVDAEAVRQALV
jgi:uncharacterized protein (DUF362 family)